ncbi:hypothetical protein D3C77_646710 [compost metagenome]
MGLCPCSRYRAMFSSMTMASSTTKPAPMVSAIKVRLLVEKPARCMKPKVPIKDSGTARLGISVAGRLRRNRKVTSTTSPTANTSSHCTPRTDARMLSVRSVRMRTCAAAGRLAVSCGSSALT